MTSHVLKRAFGHALRRYRAGFAALALGVAAFVLTLAVLQYSAHPAQAQSPEPQTGEAAGASPANAQAIVADLSITKTNGVTEVVPGMIMFYTITARNNSTEIVTDAWVVDATPSQFSPVYGTAFGTGVRDVKFVTFATGLPIYVTTTLSPGGALTLIFTGPVNSNATGMITNTVVISPPADVSDPNLSNNVAVDADPVRPTPVSLTVDLSITKTNNLTEIVVGPNGATVQYVLTARNNTGTPVSNVAVLDLIPAGYTPQSVSTFGVNITNTRVSSNTTGQPISVTTDLGPAGVLNISISGVVAPDARGILTNTAIISAPAGVVETNPANNTAIDADPIRVVTTPPQTNQLQISKTDDLTEVHSGDFITYTIIVTNPTAFALNKLRITDTLPNGFVVSTTYIDVSNGVEPDIDFANENTMVTATLILSPSGVTTITIPGTVQRVPSLWITNTVVVAPPNGTNQVIGATAVDVDRLTDGFILDRYVYLPLITK